ncbi:MAG: FUSC family protein [Acidobacteria bacterium]|nr:FUSC family protein [Acidobacteriota bacterium]
MLTETLREVLHPEWSKFHPRAALRCMPAIALAILVGSFTGHAEWGIMAASGAVSVGFGSYQELGGSRTAPMLFATLGMCVSSWIGTLAGQSLTATTVATALWGFLYVAISALGPGQQWIALQSVIWMIISTAYPAPGLHALTRGAFVLVGGLLQFACVRFFWWAERRQTPVMASAQPTGACAENHISDVLKPRSCLFLYALRAAITLGLAAALYRTLKIPNGYWIPMTAAIVLRADMRQSITRGFARMTGTILGTVLATIAASLLRPGPFALSMLVLVFVWCAYALLWVNYAIFVVPLTAYVVSLLALAGLPEPFVIHHRLLNTLLGGLISLAIHLVFFGWERSRVPHQQLAPEPHDS